MEREEGRKPCLERTVLYFFIIQNVGNVIFHFETFYYIVIATGMAVAESKEKIKDPTYFFSIMKKKTTS